jgi:protein CpxP
MSMRSIPYALVGLLLGATLSAPAALAQSATAPAGQTQRGAQSTPDRVEQRIADLHARLQITPDQQPLWDKFAQVMRDNARQMRQVADDRSAKIKAMNASDNMQSYAQIVMQHAQDLQSLATAFQPLYASLSPEQQRTADTMFRDVAMRRAARHRR